MNKKHITIIGLGGVGGYFGFKISQNNETFQQYTISFVARGETYKKLKEEGLMLISPEHRHSKTRPNEVYEHIKDVPHPDLVLVCVKEYDLERVCNDLKEVINKETILLPMMNGVDIYERMRKVLPDVIILPSCIYIASHIKEKGVIEHKGKGGKIIFGKDPLHPSKDVSWVLSVLDESRIDFDFKDNPSSDIWTKFTFIASFGLVTAKYNSSMGKVCTDPVQKDEATQIMKEIELIAHKKDISLDKDLIEKTFEKASTFPFETPTSIQLDINSGKENSELELFAGAIIRYGKELGIEVPFTQKIYEELKAKINS
ncbi:2-dehydropantoate 2-reductase [Chryseobacterium sp. T16E-39]|uniref:ketopantoate reductase family protein n=1 Tax=Chryseobacterium sp. T16E-39 TaxID=2015076 RepID=UPI000B5B4329|nr:2-dehydropantoate 2-reductase [Chryseobacterium sp. T16E-39]ASK29545.1 2-dehydropantoate 2-reductase [Chryseobacterium sp. T16E-39]